MLYLFVDSVVPFIHIYIYIFCKFIKKNFIEIFEVWKQRFYEEFLFFIHFVHQLYSCFYIHLKHCIMHTYQMTD